MKLIQTTLSTTQKVPANALINVGEVDRRVSCKNPCGVPTFCNNDDSITANWVGYYLVSVDMTVESATAVPVVICLLENGNLVEGADINETYVGGDVKKLSLSKIIRVCPAYCPCKKIEPSKLQLVNMGNEEIKIASINFSVIKVD